MEPIKLLYPLKGLNEKDCESLFNGRAFGKGEEANNNHPELVEIGRDIVKKCGGVPLAAKALGSLLCHTRNKKEWLDVLDTEIWKLCERENEPEQEILPALRISYNHLPSHLKQCFAYCSIFPQDHEIDVDDLIHQWMAHGFIQPPPPNRGGGSHSTLEDIGNRYFRELLWRSFFQELREVDRFGRKKWVCKMHDLVHNLARWVAGSKVEDYYYDYSGDSSSSSSCSNHIISHQGGVRRHIVSHVKKADTLNHQTLVIPLNDKPQKLRTLYWHHDDDDYGKLGISVGFISPLQGLRVLQLRNLKIKHVPKSIGYQLQQLRYVDLSGNSFKALPNSICRLYNLQTLRLGGCGEFKQWPRDMTKLVSLRHLELDEGLNIRYMPRGLGQLSSLQTLGYFAVAAGGRKKAGLGELHGLNQLRGKLVIRRLENVRDARDAEEANLKEKSELQSLKLDWKKGKFDYRGQGCLEDIKRGIQVLGNLQPHPNLKEFKIINYVGIEMPRWMLSSSLLPHLMELDLCNCYNLKCLPLIGEFPCLRNLQLTHLDVVESICNKVEMLGNNNGGGGEGEGKPLVLFPSLEKLYLYSTPNLERWTISVEATEAQHSNNHLHWLSSMFPSLTHLTFSRCNKLTRVPILSGGGISHLTSLQTLRIEHLERLASLPDCPAPATLERLTISNCPNLLRFADCFFDHLKSLSEFTVLDCEKLTSLQEGIRHLITLKLLQIGGCPGLVTLPVGLGSLSSLEQLLIRNCSNLSSLPKEIQHLTALKKLKIFECPALKTLPKRLGSFSSLEELKIWDCYNLSSLPEGIQHLASRGVLQISNCPNLSS
ncbi:disease resistance protein RGA2-like [Telopea speciosissima]|uniref:disease resistance protein RGA2-like n=1 Tax=Telopea speciosissima TaxID=54955 RepID=UPI001CC34496|nr:disease resistance protein RGA2-like [Telopea speciosissima]